MSGDTTYQALKRLTYLPNRAAVKNGTVIAGQEWNNVLFSGGNVSNLNITGSIFTDVVFAQNANPQYLRGRLVYDTVNECLTFFNNDSNVSLQIGQEEWIRVINNTGVTIPNGSAVYLNGAVGDVPTIALAQANSATTLVCAGLTTEAIANGATGYVTSIGVVRTVNTAAMAAGQTVYVSSSVAGGLTTTVPAAPNFRFRVGIVVRSDAVNGSIHVTPSTGAIGTGAANQVLGVNAAGTAQEYKTITAGAGINVTNAANSITIANTGTGGSGVSGQVAFWNGTTSLSGDNAFFWDITNKFLGFNTVVPTHTVTLGSTSTGYVHYNTASQATNYERFHGYWSGSIYNMVTENAGTGQNRDLLLGGGGTFMSLQSNQTNGYVNISRGTNAAGYVLGLNGGISGSATLPAMYGCNSVVNQTGTAGYSIYKANLTETAVGSGSKRFIDMQISGVDKFVVDNTGAINTGSWNATTIPVNKGGTNQTTYTDGQLLIGNTTGNTLTKSTLTAGPGVTVTNGNGSITLGGYVVQEVNTTVGTTLSGTTTFAINATTPDQTRGDQFLSLTITPKSSTNILTVESMLIYSNGSGGPNNVSAALYQDSGNAVATNFVTQTSNGGQTSILLHYSGAAGTVSATTFKVRAGSQGPGTTTVNGSFNGTMCSYIKITERTP